MEIQERSVKDLADSSGWRSSFVFFGSLWEKFSGFLSILLGLESRHSMMTRVSLTNDYLAHILHILKISAALGASMANVNSVVAVASAVRSKLQTKSRKD